MAELMLEAMDEYTYGLDNIDPEAIDRGNRLIQQATDIINEIPIEDIAE